MQTLFYSILTALAVMAGVIIITALAAIFFLRWVARGESDVNGDPERDAFGLSPEEPVKYVCSWHPTADKPVYKGDPNARIASHGMCPECAEQFGKTATELKTMEAL